MNRSEFAEKLLQTNIPSNMPIEDQQKALDSLMKTAHNLLPEKLYRYRSCNELNIDAFDKDELWVSTPECMNDGFDTRIFIDKKEVMEQYKSILPDNTDKTTVLNTIPDLTGFPQQLIQAREDIHKLTDEEISRGISTLGEWLINDAVQAVQQMNSVGQQAVKISCFSENIKSPAMWGLYASDESGFALEYDFSDTPYAQSPDESYTRETTLFPVIYCDERFKVPTQYIIYLLQYRQIHTMLIKSGIMNSNPIFAQQYLASGVCPDNLMVTKIALHKSKEWEREAEWRLFCSSMNDAQFTNAKHGCCIKKPTAIYLGRRIKPINEKILRKFAEEKTIPVYKMKLDDDSATYEMKFE